MELSVSECHHHTTRILLQTRPLLLVAVKLYPATCRVQFLSRFWLVLVIVIGQRHDFLRTNYTKLPGEIRQRP